MKHIILCILSAAAAFGQAQTPFRVYPSSGSLTGQLWLQERRTNPGQNVVKLEAPQSIASDFSLILPNADGAAGRCLKTDGSGALGWRACGETFDVTTYGAACDNSTDDTTAIQAAITAAEAAGGGTVQFPLGTCLVTTVTVTGNFIGLAGKHRNASVLKGTANSSIVRINTDGSDMYFFSARSMTVQGNTGASTAAFEVYGPNNFDRSSFENLYIVDVRRGIWTKNNPGFIAWFSYLGNYCDTVNVSGGTCIDIESVGGANQSVISNSMFANHTSGIGVRFTGDFFGDDTIVNNMSEQGNYFVYLDCVSPCLYGANFVITGNKIDNTAIAPMYINNIQTSTIAWNRILGGGVVDTVSVNGNSSDLILDSYYSTGLRSTRNNESWALGAFASGRLRLGETDVDLSGTTNGVSIKDDDENVTLALGQSASYNVQLGWIYDATATNAYGFLATFGNNSTLAYRAKSHLFETGGSSRWKIENNGHFFAEADNAYDIGASGANRPRNLYVAGTADIAGNLSAAVINATGSPAYRVAGTTVIDASRNATFQGLTVLTTVSSSLIPTTTNIYENGSSSARWATTYTTGLNVAGVMTLASTVTGDFIPTTNNTAVLGNSSNYWNQVRSQDFYVENSGRIRPTTTNTGSVGISTARFNKGWFTDLDITGTITPPSGTAFTGTKTVRASGGASDCTLTFSSGIMTGGTC